MVILAIWLALSGAIYSWIALSVALNRIFSHREWDSKTNQPIRFKGFFKLTNHITGKWKTKKPLFCKFLRFQNGSNKVVIELRVMQFWSEIILAINFQIELALHAPSILISRVWFQTKLHSTQFNYHYKSYLWFQIELAVHARSILKSHVWFQTKLPSTQFNYHNVIIQCISGSI